ncbi:OmpP1/FadL family transporter [Roseobacter weihaiensis]|uniref:OmpP1/FadL family transporter n=1 Tax=Roseobacter weihaiensis TaxID=2763262 RepID=UPI001D0BAA08|nr:outer membrane protein transport protein [Roseobacter sp. H9]
MRNYITSVTVLCLAAGAAHAGALDRTGQSVNVLFEDGRYVEFSLGFLSPDITGESIAPQGGTLGPVFPIGGRSGDIGESNFNFGAAYKADINDRWSYALIFDQPFKAEVNYPSGTGYFAQDSRAEFNSYAITTLLQYNMANGFSVYGGPRFQRTDATAAIAFVGDYEVEADNDWGVGYVFGAAYERPEIALRVSLTYSSEIAHENDVSEVFGNPFLAGLSGDSTAEFETPQSINLEAQTGIAPNTLLFGSVRWVDWSDFDLSPDQYVGVTGQPLLSYIDDITTYTVGLGYRVNETWSFAGSVSYEENTENLFTNLGPADGQTSIGLAAIYTRDKMTVTTGVRYAWIGDTTTAVQGAPAAEFNDNSAVAFGIQVGYNF